MSLPENFQAADERTLGHERSEPDTFLPPFHGGIEWDQSDRKLAYERAEALRRVSPVAYTERLRTVQRDDELGAARALVIGVPLALVLWILAAVIVVAT